MKVAAGKAMSVLPDGLSEYAALSKLRMTSLVVATAAVGFYLGHKGSMTIDTVLLIVVMSGTALMAIGSGAINQVLERQQDARMVRTSNRPVASGRMSSHRAAWFGVMVSIAGLCVLALGANFTSAGVGLAAWLLYVFAYTPLKSVTPLSVIVGAFPGALPAVIGWTAATGSLDAAALMLFTIVFLWQVPHFLSIAWIYRDDYANAGYAVLTVVEPGGKRTIRQMILFSAVLIPISLLPTFFGLAGHYYYVGALVMGFAFLAFGLEVARLRTRDSARQLMLASLVYLPALFVLMALDKASA